VIAYKIKVNMAKSLSGGVAFTMRMVVKIKMCETIMLL
jgi:hypothetical protein